MQNQEVIEGWRGVLVDMGLGRPLMRGACAATVTGMVMSLAKYPKSAFRPDGSARPHRSLSMAQDAVSQHFLLIPLGVGAFVALCT